jgi:hypothetical protein
MASNRVQPIDCAARQRRSPATRIHRPGPSASGRTSTGCNCPSACRVAASEANASGSKFRRGWAGSGRTRAMSTSKLWLNGLSAATSDPEASSIRRPAALRMGEGRRGLAAKA